MVSLQEDIRLIVCGAIETGAVLQVARVARELASAHPEERLCAAEIADLVIEAGVSASIVLEIDRPK